MVEHVLNTCEALSLDPNTYPKEGNQDQQHKNFSYEIICILLEHVNGTERYTVPKSETNSLALLEHIKVGTCRRESLRYSRFVSKEKGRCRVWQFGQEWPPQTGSGSIRKQCGLVGGRVSLEAGSVSQKRKSVYFLLPALSVPLTLCLLSGCHASRRANNGRNLRRCKSTPMRCFLSKSG